MEVIGISKVKVALEIAGHLDKRKDRGLYNYLCKLYPASYKKGWWHYIQFKTEMWMYNL